MHVRACCLRSFYGWFPVWRNVMDVSWVRCDNRTRSFYGLALSAADRDARSVGVCSDPSTVSACAPLHVTVPFGFVFAERDPRSEGD